MTEIPKNQKSDAQKPREIIIESGKNCTVSGEFEVKGQISTTVYVSKSELMPLYCGKKVKWILITKG